MGLTRIRAEQISDIDYKQAVRVITLTDIALAGGAPNQVDGVNLTANDRVLVAGNDPASENGLYFVQTVGAGSNGTWVRSSDGNTTGEIEAGMIVMVTEGTVYKDTQWKLSTNNPIVVGTTALDFVINILSQVGGSNTQVQFNNSGTMGGSPNLTWDGSNLYANGAVSVTGNVTAGNVLVGNVIIANNGANGITLYQSNGTTKATNTTGVILALGDSWIGGGYMANSTTVWANVASRAFQATIVNQAVGGRLSADVLANLTADVAAAGGYNNINCAVINVGGNDKLQSPAANIAQYNTTLYNNLTSILNVLTGNGVPVILSPAPDIDVSDFYATGIAPDYAAPINTGQYVDDPQYAVIANNYQGVTVSTNSMSYLFNHPAEFLIPGGFHPTLTQGQQCFVDIIASAGQGLNQNSLNAAMTMSFDLIGFNQGIELGTTTLESTPFIDFHSSGNSTVDYDSRIIGSGGSGTAGTGNINFFTATANVSGNILSSGSIIATGNVTGGNLSAGTGTVGVGNIVNSNANGIGNIGSSTVYFNTVFAKATSAQYADLAEIYTTDQEIAPGTVVCFGGQKEVCKSHSYAQSSIAGIVSTNPAYIMNSRATGIAVALTGRVPCLVVGAIDKGDLVVSSNIPGVATKLQPGDWVPGCVIGKALENYNNTEVGTIEVVAGRV
jgi:hypothetical protein